MMYAMLRLRHVVRLQALWVMIPLCPKIMKYPFSKLPLYREIGIMIDASVDKQSSIHNVYRGDLKPYGIIRHFG
jgi:hypothetical protein